MQFKAKNGTVIRLVRLQANQAYAIVVGGMMLNELYNSRAEAVERIKELL